MSKQTSLDDYGDILTASEVKGILKIGTNQVYRLLSQGVIENFKIGNRRKIPKRCLCEYISKMTCDSEKDTY